MTAGYPDFRRRAEHVDDVLVSVGADPYTGTETRGPFFVAHFATLLLQFRALTGLQRVTVEHGVTATFSTVIGQTVYEVEVNDDLVTVIPLLANYLRIVLDAPNPADARTYDMQAFASTRALPGGAIPVFNMGLHTGNLNVGAGATSNQAIEGAYFGEATVGIDTDAADFLIVLEGADLFGAFQRVANWDETNPVPLDTTLLLPPLRNRMSITNNDGVIRGFNVNVTPRFL